jgi:subtilase family serine protease
LLDSGIDGRGETVTVLDPVPSPAAPAPGATDIRQDLARFDSTFHLPAARIHIVTSLVGPASPWRATIEEAEDTEIVHTVAPAAVIRVVLMPATVLDSAANATADMLAGLRLAVSRTDVASISWSLGEHLFTPGQVAEMHSILRVAAARHVTAIASSGDHGAASDPWFGNAPVREVSLPAADPLVLGSGGTTLTANRPAGTYAGETAWGGSASGTSASAPLWGGLAALADQYAHYDLGFINPAIYAIASGYCYHGAFHDITTGNNAATIGSITVPGYQAASGWDAATGWGTPDAQALIPLLAKVPAAPAAGTPAVR